MSYVEYNHNIVASLPQSSALNRVEYDPISSEVLVFWESRPDKAYVHKVVGKEDFDGLVSLIEYQNSGYYGYKQWETNMKERFVKNDYKAFNEYYQGLTNNQKQNFQTWARQLLRGLW